MGERKEKVSVIIPCYNSEKSVKSVTDRVLKTLKGQDKYDYELLLVNDGSKDNTWEVIKGIALSDPCVTAINFSMNFGQHSAIMALYREMDGDYVVGLDDDGEHNPEDMFKLVEALDDEHDYMCADYNVNKDKFRSFGTRLNNWMAEEFIGKPKGVDFSSFFALKRFVVDEIIRYEQPYPYAAGLLLRGTKKLGSIPMERGKRMYGKSGYTMKSLMKLWINGYTGFSLKPLRMANFMGILTAMAGFVFAIVIIIRRLVMDIAIPGYASTMACITFFSGMIMLLLGIIGEYIGRIYISINNAPQYVIKEKIKNQENVDIRVPRG